RQRGLRDVRYALEEEGAKALLAGHAIRTENVEDLLLAGPLAHATARSASSRTRSGSNPTLRSASSPSRKRMSVGMLRMPYRPATSGARSVSTLPTSIRPT